MDYDKMYAEFWVKVKENLNTLEPLLLKISEHWHYEDLIYRFYHCSYKVQYIKGDTLEMYEALKKLEFTDRGLNEQFKTIVEQGSSDVKNINKEWGETRKWVEAFLHCKYFLEMVVKYGKELDAVPMCLPSGLAAVLELYNIR